ncbi:monocarboxylate transporter 6 isoform X3 [Strigops habroptila]|uniref:monocarboxylate transporter 6 isoform X3 n=1 Tax=Strigops habroptila TaxID=2489341 RepID=UPI0011D001A2|nr:monocarboxylate transporter 6 isoform X3 [Strigops habroptila]
MSCPRSHTLATLRLTNPCLNLSRLAWEEKEAVMSQGQAGERKAANAQDQGWAWMVLLAAVVLQAMTLGFPSCIGIFFTDLQRDFQASNSETSWFPSIMVAVLHGGGLGSCFSFQAGVTALGYYFVRWRTLANAMASTGVSLGFTLWPLLSQYLLDEMGWRNTFLIFGGILLNCCVCGAIMRPVQLASGSVLQSPKPGEEPRRRAEETQLSNGASSPHHELQKQSRRTACFHVLQKYLAFDIFCQNKRFQIYTIGVTWMMMGFALPHIYLVPYAIQNGVEERRAALLISVIGFINIFIRPFTGLLSGHRVFSGRRIYLFSLAVLLCGLSNFICVASAEFSVLIIYCVILSIAMSGIGALTFQVLMDVVEMDRFSSALGLFTIVESITLLLGPPLTGVLVDITNDFHYVFYNSSFFLISAALFMALSFCALEKKTRLKEASKVPVDNPSRYQYSEMPTESQPESQPPPAVVYITSI